MDIYVWIECVICRKLMPHKRWLGHVVNFLECLGCGDSIVEHKKEAA